MSVSTPSSRKQDIESPEQVKFPKSGDVATSVIDPFSDMMGIAGQQAPTDLSEILSGRVEMEIGSLGTQSFYITARMHEFAPN